MRAVAIVSGVVALALVAGAYLLWRPRDSAPPPASRVIFRKTIPGGREIVVRRGPTVPVSTVEGLVDSRGLANSTGVFPVSIEMSGGPGESLTIWSWLVLDFKEENFKRYAVLDLLPEGDGLVVATAEEANVFLTRVHLPGGTAEYCVLRHHLWSREVSVLPLDETSVKVVLRHPSDGKGVVAEVTDLRDADPRGTVVFKQVGDKWAFEP